MDQSNASWNEAEMDSIREQLGRIVASDFFVHGPRQVRFLRYIVEETLAGQANRLNQFAVGIEVFDRDESFDPSTDAIVRVEAGRLRSKLAEYYAGPGHDDSVVITMPKGGYGVAVELRSEMPDKPISESGQSGAHLRQNVIIALLVAAILLGSIYVGFFRAPGAVGLDQSSRVRIQGTTPAIAVLPFENMSADPEQEYFSDGIAEDIITDLSILSDLTVIARHSSFVYKDQSVSIGDIGRDLGVQYVLEGSVRKDSDRLRITAQLIDVRTEGHIWAERFDRDLDDVFAVQDEVTRRIVDALQLTLSIVERERLGHRGTDNVEAHDLLLRGQEQFYRFTREGVDKAIVLFEQARKVDSNYAAAYAWQSRALVYSRISGFDHSHRDTITPAIRLAERAIELDDLLPIAHANHGWALRWDGEPRRGIDALSRAIELDPNYANAYLWQSLILSSMGQGREAAVAIENSLLLDPNYGVTQIFALGRSHLAMGNFDEALGHFNRGIERNPYFVPNHVYKLSALESLGQQDARVAAEQMLSIAYPDYKQSASYQTYLKERAGSGKLP